MASSVSESQMSSRTDSSLFRFTQNFIEYMAKIYPDPVDSKLICEHFMVPKRKVYYVTNISMGLNLIKKCGVGLIKWVGGDIRKYTDCDVPCTSATDELDMQITELVHKNNKLMESDDAIHNVFSYLSDLNIFSKKNSESCFLIKTAENPMVENKTVDDQHIFSIETKNSKLEAFFINDGTYKDLGNK